MRRGSRDFRRTVGTTKSLFSLILALAAGRPVFNADYYAIDGVSGKVASFIDWNDPTHTLAQATGANQVVLPAVHADFGGKLCANFTGVENYLSNRAASAWNWLVDGTGMDWFAVFTKVATTTTILFNTGSGANNNGQCYWTNASDGYWELRANPTLIFQRSTAVLAANVGTYLNASHITGGSPASSLRLKNGAANTGVELAAPPVTPSNAMRLGNIGAARWRSLPFFPLLTSVQRTSVQAYIQADTGIAP